MKNVIITSILMLTTGTIMCSERKIQERLIEQAAIERITTVIQKECIFPHLDSRANDSKEIKAIAGQYSADFAALRQCLNSCKMPNDISPEAEKKSLDSFFSCAKRITLNTADVVDTTYADISTELQKELYAIVVQSLREGFEIMDQEKKDVQALLKRHKDEIDKGELEPTSKEMKAIGGQYENAMQVLRERHEKAYVLFAAKVKKERSARATIRTIDEITSACYNSGSDNADSRNGMQQ